MPIYHQTVLLPKIEFFCHFFFPCNIILGFKFLEHKRSWRIKSNSEMDIGQGEKGMFGVFFTGAPDTSFLLDNKWVGGREGCSVFSLLQTGCTWSHYNPRSNALLSKQKLCTAVHYVASIGVTLHCIAMHWSDLNHKCIASCIVYALCKTLSCSTSA